jgi:twitching motility two-component system response regulator PilG
LKLEGGTVKNIKVMVVDDSSTIRKSAEMFLGKAGFTVVSIEDGLEVLTRIDEENPDLVFIDVIMPKIDGLQACQIIKRNSKFKNTPIIFLSSKDSEFDKARGLMMGANDYLTKPFTKEGIIDIVKRYVKPK